MPLHTDSTAVNWVVIVKVTLPLLVNHTFICVSVHRQDAKDTLVSLIYTLVT